MPLAVSVDQRPPTAIDLLCLWAERTPDAVATFHRRDDGSWTPTTWAGLWDETQRAASALRQAGLGRGDRLAILSRTCKEWLVAELATALVGGIVVGVDAHAGDEQIAWVLERVSPKGLLVDTPAHLNGLRAAQRERLAFVFVIDHLNAASDATAQHWAAATTAAPAAGLRTVNPDDPATWIFTSGTSGTPKGIEYSHAQMMTAAWAMLDEFPDFSDARLACWLPMAAMFQRMINLVAFASRSTTYFVEDPREIMDRVGEIKPTVFTSVPRFYERVHQGIRARLEQQNGLGKFLAMAALATGAEHARQLRLGRRPGAVLRLRHALLDRLVLQKIRNAMGGEMKWMFSGSAATPVWLIEFFHGVGLLLLEGYATSENAVPIAANRPGDHRPGSVGKPFAMNQLRFSDEGEVLVKSPVLFAGYLGDPSRERFTADGFYRTGDLGHVDQDGFLYLTGRVSEIIKTSAGRRISPVGVESVYAESRFVEQIMVVGDNRAHLTALISPNQTALADVTDRERVVAEDLTRLGARLPRHEQIRAFSLVPEPFSIAAGELTPTLKMRRAAIQKRYAAVIDGMYSPAHQSATPAVHTLEPVGADR